MIISKKKYKGKGGTQGITFVKMDEYDSKRHKSRCIYYRKSDSYCAAYQFKCYGSAHCDKYREKIKEF